MGLFRNAQNVTKVYTESKRDSLLKVNSCLNFQSAFLILQSIRFITYLLIYLLTYLLTYLLIPWSRVLAEKLTSSQLVKKFPTFMDQKFRYGIHKCPLTVPILSQIYPVYATKSHFLKTYLNTILAFTVGSFMWSLSLRFPHQNPVLTSSLPYR